MTNKNNGGPAFPANHFDLAPDETGMTLRDWFAGKAMQGCLATEGWASASDIAAGAYDMADAMLKAREVKP